MRVTVRTPRQGWSAEIDVPAKCTVGTLRRLAAKAADISRTRSWSSEAPARGRRRGRLLKPGDTPRRRRPPRARSRRRRALVPRRDPRRATATRPTRRDGDDRTTTTPSPRPWTRRRCAPPPARRPGPVSARPRARDQPRDRRSTRAWVGVGLWLRCRLHSADLGPVFVIRPASRHLRLVGEEEARGVERVLIFNEGVRELPGRSTRGRWITASGGGWSEEASEGFYVTN